MLLFTLQTIKHVKHKDVTYPKDKYIEPIIDETKVPPARVSTKRDTETEKISKTIYLREQDIGRIIIEEIQEENPKEVYGKFDKTSEVVVTRMDDLDVSRQYKEDNVIKVGKLVLYEVEKSQKEEERFLKHTVESPRKARYKKDRLKLDFGLSKKYL